MSRERIEDLGRLAVHLDIILEKDVFNEIGCRAKDFAERFYEKDKESQEDLLRTLAYDLVDIKSELCDCRCIARGEDDLNEPAE